MGTMALVFAFLAGWCVVSVLVAFSLGALIRRNHQRSHVMLARSVMIHGYPRPPGSEPGPAPRPAGPRSPTETCRADLDDAYRADLDDGPGRRYEPRRWQD